MTGRFIAATALKDVRRQLADPLGLLTWMGLPLIIGGLIVLVSGGGGSPRGRLLVADEDESFLSNAIGGAAVQGPIAELFDVTPVDRDEGRHLMDAGGASALVILPAGLQDAVLGRGTAEIRLVTNPSQRILPGMIEEALEIAVELAFYGERLLGEPARRILDGPPDGGSFFSNDAMAELATAINTRLRGLEGTLSPPVLDIEYADPPDADEAEAPASAVDLGLIFLPGMIFMSILFTAQGVSGDVWAEKRLGTLRRAASAPPPMAALLAGKLAAGGALVGAVAMVGVGLGMVLLDLPPLHAPPRRALDHVRGRDHAQLLRAAPAARLGTAGRQPALEPGAVPARDGRRLVLPVRGDARVDGGHRWVDAERPRPGASQGDRRRAAGCPRPVDGRSCHRPSRRRGRSSRSRCDACGAASW